MCMSMERRRRNVQRKRIEPEKSLASSTLLTEVVHHGLDLDPLPTGTQDLLEEPQPYRFALSLPGKCFSSMHKVQQLPCPILPVLDDVFKVYHHAAPGQSSISSLSVETSQSASSREYNMNLSPSENREKGDWLAAVERTLGSANAPSLDLEPRPIEEMVVSKMGCTMQGERFTLG